MDGATLGAAIAICKAIPGTAANRAETAAQAAEVAAQAAQEHSMGVSISGTAIVFTPAGN